MGFFLVAPLVPDEFMLPDQERAELLAEAVQRALAPTHAGSSELVQSASNAFAQYLDRNIAIAHEQFQQALES